MPSNPPSKSIINLPLPISGALVPSFVFLGLTLLTEPPWRGLNTTTSGYTLLGAAISVPLLTLCLPSRGRIRHRLLAVAISSCAAVFLTFHSGLGDLVVFDLDLGRPFGLATVGAAAGVWLAAFAVPAGLLLAQRLGTGSMVLYTLVPGLAGALGQLSWFGLNHLQEGASGIGFWLASRVLVHAAMGLCAGVVAGGAALNRPFSSALAGGTFSQIANRSLPAALPASSLLCLGIAFSGAARVMADRADLGRIARVRFDDYILAVDNLRRARGAGLVYEGLHDELASARGALLGAAAVDGDLERCFSRVLPEIERPARRAGAKDQLTARTMELNRQLLKLGEPYFFEPHDIAGGGARLVFLLRYAVTGRSRLWRGATASVPLLRLRRMDDILIDTPFTGLSYPGLGTVLMDHVDDVALRSYARLFAPDATRKRPGDGRFAETRRLYRQDRRDALLEALVNRGHGNIPALERLAALAREWEQVADLEPARLEMDPETLAAYDSLAEILARETEVHEARHAFDGELEGTLPALVELGAGDLAAPAFAEIRAYLTEMVDGPLGPRFALSTVIKMIAGEEARANAYFFAAVTIVEGLWGERIRRPDVLELEGPDGPLDMVAPISARNPGWLSYSRILGAHLDLRRLEPEELRQRARDLYESLFREDYERIARSPAKQ